MAAVNPAVSAGGRTHAATLRLQHHGSGGELFAVFLVNLLLRIVTLNIYHFWAKTRVRRYLWSQLSFDGERFEYTGQGMELFLGFLKALGVLILIGIGVGILATLLAMIDPSLTVVSIVIVYLGFLFLVGVGIYGAWRYVLSRTRWRSIRFAQAGSAYKYGALMLGYTLLTVITLGFYMPFMRNELNNYMLGNMYYGNERVEYFGKGKDLFGRYIMSFLLTIPTLGLIWFWYMAAEARYVFEHTRFQQMRFRLGYTGGALLWLMFSNLLLLAVTLGLGFPWVLVRSVRFFTDRLEVIGQLDHAAIAQSAATAPKTGEGLAEAFDLGGI